MLRRTGATSATITAWQSDPRHTTAARSARRRIRSAVPSVLSGRSLTQKVGLIRQPHHHICAQHRGNAAVNARVCQRRSLAAGKHVVKLQVAVTHGGVSSCTGAGVLAH